MVVQHHQFNGHKLGQTLGDSEGQGSLACCSPWGPKESDTTERLNKNNLSYKEATDTMNENTFFKAGKCVYFLERKIKTGC